jgi:proline dehydrogenase
MSLARTLLLQAADSRWLADQMARRPFARRAVRRFMPGEEIEDALAAARLLADRGLGTVFTQLGENLATLDEAGGVREHYLGVFDRIRELGLPSLVSVKPTQLGLDHSAEACTSHLLALAERAVSTGSSLWIDMEDSRYVDRTLELYQRVKARFRPVGLCLQAYLRRTPADLEKLLTLKPWIRLVKGAYAEPPAVAFPAKADTDAVYFRLADRLLHAAATRDAFPVFGTHDRALLDRIVARAAELGVPDGGYEIHMLYGIGSADQEELARAGRKVRTLISYGRAWFKWYVRRLAERPANVWFVVRSLVA